MPATGGDITHVKTFAKSVSHLESIETANDDTGDLGFVRVLDRYYTLDKESLLPRDGALVLYTKNARQSLNPAATPGRWVATCNYLTGCTGAAGPSSASISSAEDHFETDTDVPVGVTAPLLSAMIETTAPSERLDISMTFSGEGEDGVSTLIAQLNVDGSAVATSGGTGSTSEGPNDLVSGAIRRIVTVGPGVHTIEVAMTAAGASSFVINAASNPFNEHASLVIVRLGAP